MSRGDDSNRQCQCALPVSTTRASHGGALMHGALTMLLESLLSRFQILPRTISSADSVAPTLHSNENGRENTFFTERRHSEQSGVGLTGSYETPRIAQAEVRQKCANSILVRVVPKGLCAAACAQGAGGGGAWRAVRRLGARGRGMPQGCAWARPP